MKHAERTFLYLYNCDTSRRKVAPCYFFVTPSEAITEKSSFCLKMRHVIFLFSFSLVYLRLQPRKSSYCFRISFEIYLSKPKAKLLRKGITSAGFFSSCYIPLLCSSSLVRGAILLFSFSAFLHPLNCHDIFHAGNTRFTLIDAYASGANGKRGGKKGW